MDHFLTARLASRNLNIVVLCHNAFLFFTSRTRSISNTIHHKGGNFDVYSLINLCELCPEMALKLLKRLQLKNPDGSNATVDLLRNYGFSETQLCRLVKRQPSVLLSKKLKFLHSIGFSTTDLPKILIGNTSILGLSLTKTIIPRYKIIRSLVSNDKEAVSTLKHGLWFFNRRNGMDDSVSNIEVLRQLGVPQSSISLLVTNFPTVAFMKHLRFVTAVNKVKEMRFDPLKSNFLLAVQVLTKMNEVMWKSKLEIFEKWGWSRDMCLTAFKSHPHYIMASEKKITKVLSFLAKDMGLPLEDICPAIFNNNLEKTVIPRFAVVKILKSRGLVKSDLKLSSFVRISEKVFLERYVTRFQKIAPLLFKGT
ncbi:uncharacterized protein LOC113854181 [Abrus precatorius]|uniref:Uncharacterized protein LOC113854181 n=1 Tax=Abrus precatorius TaxID=3816 RepID=A0A8B8KAS3_ABRPR|nr:uncharacterized protein LOC113854181 [Abrus precatorius]